MLRLVKIAFRKAFEIWLWANLVVCTVGGGVTFYFTVAQVRTYYGISVNGGLVFLGVIVGFILGALVNIFVGGLISTFLSIDANLEKLKDKYAE